MTQKKWPRGVLIRKVTRAECKWLDKDIPEGKVVYIWGGPTFGCIGSGIAVSDKPGEYPFYEIPEDSVKWDD